MTLRYIEPRNFNSSSKVEQFIRLWDKPLDDRTRAILAEKAKVTQRRSEYGNINNAGTPYPSPSCLVNRFHPDFESVLEPGVRDLVYAVGIDHGLVTYTSCEGHDYRQTNEWNDVRHVGLIARNEAELEAVKALFERVAERAGLELSDSPIELGLMIHTVAGDGREYPAVDFFLLKRDKADWDAYFAALDEASVMVVDKLRSEPSLTERAYA